MTIAAQWTLVGLAIGLEGQSLRPLGVSPPSRRDAVPLLAAAVLGSLALAATGPDIDRVGVEIAVASAITIGVVEEVLCPDRRPDGGKPPSRPLETSPTAPFDRKSAGFGAGGRIVDVKT